MGGHGIRVIGIDASLRSTGFAVVEAQGSALRPVEHGRLRFTARTRLSGCLRGIGEGLAAAIARTSPEAAAIEGAFFFRNARTAMSLGQARGVAIAACAAAGVPVYEYAPRRVKQAVVGFGGAAKEQVQAMVVSLLGLADPPQEDESDALAIAICHLHNRTGLPDLMPKEV